ncbi:MAG TPA: acyl-CoA dehydrogenase C-terminal domain-containing protein, partial [Rhodopila sp.]|nr:acyl-CoA dehydrogenase C-terminal domain-containing protein [Rhodopila sp.]
LQGLEDISPELIDSVLEEAAKVAEDVLLPINASGDETGCVLENGVVRTPKGFKEAYDTFRAGGWTAVSADPRWGGQGLPESVNKLIEEMICSANLAFSLYPGLTHGAYQAIAAHGSDALKDRYLPKMIDGTWSGTMCLTEAHCGTDLGMLRTRAVPQADGSYKVSGSKIFISAGEHDLTENIIHLVLARLPDAPKGTRGISLFLVPKFIPTEDGRPGARNGVICTAIEHKMGIKGSATCQLTFEDATGWLVGTPNKGLANMFTMMNSERLSVGIQGLGAAETSYQSAVAYARDRIQGRSLGGVKDPEKAADPIIVHPDVRRMLLTIRAYTEGCRALGGWVSRQLDEMERSADPEARQRAEDFTALMTPVVKALFTDLGFEATNIGMQVYGGHGYIRDHGMEQLVRDARISMIYEGTNGIQALDLVGRKLPQGAGRMLRTFFHPANDLIERNSDHPVLGDMIKGFAKAFGALQLATAQIAAKGMADPEEAGAAATEYLRLFGLVALGFMWARSAVIAVEKLARPDAETAFYKAKLTTARFYMERILPQVAGLLTA